jgi:hypothetical protein
MYPSGAWEGFWVQDRVGRGEMTEFTLHFAGGRVRGEGKDVVGRFTFAGTYDEATGAVRMVKQYLGQHQVTYEGRPDGEGSIQGTWNIWGIYTGPFVLRPALPRPTGTEPIQEIS